MRLTHLISETTKQIMKGSLHITAVVDQPDLLKDLVEKLACRRNDQWSLSTPINMRKMIDSSSTEAYVSGTIGLDFFNGVSDEQVNIPFITCFMFTCIKSGNQPYALAWSNSLS